MLGAEAEPYQPRRNAREPRQMVEHRSGQGRGDRLVGAENPVEDALLHGNLDGLISRVGRVRRRCTASKSASVSLPLRSGTARMLAAATASWIARLMPTPPIGDIAWAQSPMHKSPGRHQRWRRSTVTVSSFTSSHSRSSATRSRRKGAMRTISSREELDPALADRVEPALADHKGALPVIAAVEHHQQPAVIDRPALWLGSPGLFESRIHKTSIARQDC